MGRCVIHIGMHKTGTSSIQQSLNGFADMEFVYYKDHKGRKNHSAAIFSLLGSTGVDRPRYGDRPRSGKNKERKVADIRVQDSLEGSIRSLGKRNLVLSAEGMMFLSAGELKDLACFIGNRIDEISIAAYVRPPAAYMTSLVNQRVKGGSIKELDLGREYCNYERSFSKFDDVFGREHVHLWKFDPKTFPGGCAVRDFCNRLDIDLPVEHIVRVNESLSREALALLYTYRKLGKRMGSMSMRGPEKRELVQNLMKIGSTKFRFSPDVIRPILEKNRSDIEWMEARLGESLHEDLGERQASDVREESDLLKPDPEVVSKLLARLGDRAPAGVTGETPEQQVALLVHALCGEGVPRRGSRKGGSRAAGPVTDRTSVKHGDTQMEVTELIEQMRQTNPKLLDGIPKNKAEALIANVFKHMNDTLAGTEEGVVKYDGLGQFRVRKVEREAEGQKIIRTRIVFRRAEPGPGRNAAREEVEV